MSQHLTIDSIEFAVQGASLEGELALSSMPRLASEVVEKTDNAVRYSLLGGCGSRGESLLFLRLNGELVLRCQRCLQPLKFILDVDATFELRDSLDDNVLLQEDLEDDSRDYLSASRSMDLVLLIEDEALLALPPVPRHDVCATPSMQHDPEAASPFGLLLQMKDLSEKTH